MRKIVLALTAALLLAPALAPAQQKGVELKSTAEVEVAQKDGKGEQVVKRVEASKANVLPGDTVIFTIGYVNNSDQPATAVVLGNPVPKQMLYLDGSARGEGARIDFSVDRGASFAPLEKLKFITAAGKQRDASAADVTDIRWTLERPLEKGGKGSVSYGARVK